MTDNEITKALEYCKSCSANINFEILDLIHRKNTALLELTDIINRKNAEIDRLNIVKKEYQELYDELKTENEWLKSSIKEINECLSEGDFANGIALIIRLVGYINN